MNQKYLPHILLLALTTLLVLISCSLSERKPNSNKQLVSDQMEAEIWVNHARYEFGERVQIRATLRNIGDQDVTLQDKSGIEPVLDIIVQRGPLMDPDERWVWSEAHPDDVRYTLILKPGESYQVEWSLVPTMRRGYVVLLEWIDYVGLPSTIAMGFSYDAKLE
jgi:hypothetical protein